MKKKNKALEMIKSYWWIIAVFGAIIGYASHIERLWASPEEIDKMQGSISKLSSTVGESIAAQNTWNEQQQNLTELLTANLLKKK